MSSQKGYDLRPADQGQGGFDLMKNGKECFCPFVNPVPIVVPSQSTLISGNGQPQQQVQYIRVVCNSQCPHFYIGVHQEQQHQLPEELKQANPEKQQSQKESPKRYFVNITCGSGKQIFLAPKREEKEEKRENVDEGYPND